jgi:hypothetical protein
MLTGVLIAWVLELAHAMCVDDTLAPLVQRPLRAQLLFRSASVNAHLTCSCVQLAHAAPGAFAIPLPRDLHLLARRNVGLR